MKRESDGRAAMEGPQQVTVNCGRAVTLFQNDRRLLVLQFGAKHDTDEPQLMAFSRANMSLNIFSQVGRHEYFS